MNDYRLEIERDGRFVWWAMVKSKSGYPLEALMAFTRSGAIRRGRRYIRLHSVEEVRP